MHPNLKVPKSKDIIKKYYGENNVYYLDNFSATSGGKIEWFKVISIREFTPKKTAVK